LEDYWALGRLLVISGVPASGKSSYCKWLVERSWVFINHDRANQATRGIDRTWWGLVISGQAADFVQVVAGTQGNVVLEFGFPTDLLHQVRQLKAAGAQHWWFELDHQTAREAFIARNDEWARQGRQDLVIPIIYFDRYVRDIAAHSDEVWKLFVPKIIEVLQADGNRLSNEEIHRQVLAGSTWQLSTAVPIKIGRNDPCWCGSGKKFKGCHGQ
jgi:hypothetical protein